MMTLKSLKCSSNWSKWLVVTQSVLFGNQDLEIRSHVSSFSVYMFCFALQGYYALEGEQLGKHGPGIPHRLDPHDGNQNAD